MEKVARVDNYTNNNTARTLSEGEPGSVLAGVDGALFFWLQQAHQALRVSLLQAFWQVFAASAAFSCPLH